MPFVLYRGLTEDSALLKKRSHFDEDLHSGQPLPEDLEAPLIFDIDVTSKGRDMSSIFVMPAFLALRKVYDSLLAAGVDNVDVYPTVIRNKATNEKIEDYFFLNVIGLVACADLANSEYSELGPETRIIDKVAMKASEVPAAHIFRLAEDPLKIVVSDKVQRHLIDAGFNDIHFEPVILV